jgi:hypothetical protein
MAQAAKRSRVDTGLIRETIQARLLNLRNLRNLWIPIAVSAPSAVPLQDGF